MISGRNLVLVTVLALATGLTAPVARASYPGTNGLIAYVSVAHNCPDLHVVAADGSGDRQLTNCPSTLGDPAWNAAGSRLAVGMSVGNATSPDLYTMNATGGGLMRVTNDSVDDGDPFWSKTGSVLVEGRVRSGPSTQNIATVPASGGTPTTLVAGSAGAEAGDPQFSPDGARIAFEQRNGPADDIYIVNADGSNKVDVTPGNDGNSEYPSWSPDGNYIAFASDRDGAFEIFAVDVSGGANDGQVFPITHETSVPDIQPTWSPDQTMLAYTRGCADDGCQGQSSLENGDIYTVGVSDLAHPATPHALVATSLPEFEPDWGVACTAGCATKTVDRTLTLSLKGHVTAVGELADPTGKHDECAAHKAVKIQKRSNGHWRTVASTTTDGIGDYSKALPVRAGTFRAVAPVVNVSGVICAKATSKARTSHLKHARTIPYFNLAAKPDGSAMFANGQLKDKTHFDPCTTRALVKIQKRSGSSWTTIATARSQSAGTHGLANFGVNIPIRNGEYRALAPRTKLASGDICGMASATAPWPPTG